MELNIACPICGMPMDAATGTRYKEYLTIVCSRCERSVIVKIAEDVAKPKRNAIWHSR